MLPTSPSIALHPQQRLAGEHGETKLQAQVSTPSAPSETQPEARIDEFDGGIPRMVPLARARELSRLRSARSWLQIALEYGGAGLAIYLCESFWHPAFYLLAIMWIGGRQHGIGILMHDAAHGTLLKNRRWNEFVGELLLAWPLLMTLHGYRRNHLAHHRHLNTEKDPDWMTTQGKEFDFPKRPLAMSWLLARDIIGFRAAYLIFRLRQYGGKGTSAPGLRGPARLAIYLLAILAFALWPASLRIYLMYWLIPGLTWVGLITHLRIIGEHYALPRTHFLNMTRTTYANVFDRFFVAPNNINYHLDHHLYPSVPWYNLPALHQSLQEHPLFREKAHITRGYWRLVGECVKPKGAA